MTRALRAKVIWSADAIEVFGRRGHQILRIADIAGKRRVREERGLNFSLVPREGDAQKVVISMNWVLTFDTDFKNWIEAIPDLPPEIRSKKH